MKQKILFLAFLVLFTICKTHAQSTSPSNFVMPSNFAPQSNTPTATFNAAMSSQVITFSEFPLSTTITDQYKNIGVIFGGSGAFISTDGSNPTSPVLSGTPLFQGDISGSFVKPGTNDPTIVESFTFDAGFFNEIGSTRIEWFDPDGEKLGQRINSIFGIETFTIEGGNIASWKISIVANEPAGYAIDNFSFVPVSSSILFREKSGDAKDGTWGFLNDEIPGYDHVGFHRNNKVYESHPGYDPNKGVGLVFVSPDGQESIVYSHDDGVQHQHTFGTFENADLVPGKLKIEAFEEIPISEELATDMENAILTKLSSGFQFLGPTIPQQLINLSPEKQKGGDNTFTCVGLIEWASEQAGFNFGQGFIPNVFESIDISVLPPLPFPTIEVPLLSPELLNYAMKGNDLVRAPIQWVQGFFDPVDFIITDPLGRRIGFVEGLGFFNEVPNAFYSGNGGVEQFLIPTAIPGRYTIEFVGTGDSSFAAISALGSVITFLDSLGPGESTERELFVSVEIGAMGDVNEDGIIDSDDISALNSQLNSFTDGLDDPGDLDGDGLLSQNDVILLTQLVGVLSTPQIPQAPSNLVVVNDTAFIVPLTWTDNSSNEDGFYVKRRIANGPLQTLVSLGSNVTNYSDTVTIFGEQITYSIVAFNSNGESSESNPATYSMPANISDLQLSFECYDPGTDSLTWQVFNPNAQFHPYIYAQWWSPQRDTLFAVPGNSIFRTKNNPQNGATYGDDNITGIWWIDERLLPGQPNDIIFHIPLKRSCNSQKNSSKVTISPDAGQIPFSKILPSVEKVGFTKAFLENEFEIGPNPFKNVVNLKSKSLDGLLSISITNMLGQQIYQRDIYHKGETELDLTNLGSGFYILQLKIDNVSIKRKLQKN